MKAIIAAGGKGTRLRPLTFSSNKHLLPIANKPLLLYPVEAIAETGIHEVGIIVNETRPAVEALLGTGSKWGLKFTYINQPEPLGLAHVVKISQDFLGQSPFVYHLGDNIFSAGIMRPFNHFIKEKPDALLTIVKHPENFRLGVPYFDPQGRLIKVVEKPPQPPNPYGVPGLYFFNPKVFSAFEGKHAIQPSARGELEITALYNFMLDQGYRVDTEEIDGIWLDPGKFNDMLEANQLMLARLDDRDIKGQVNASTKLTGVVIVGKDSQIIKSQIIGPVHISTGVTVKNSTIGPHVSIDRNCTIANCVIKNSIIMEQSTLKDIDTPIVDSLIGKNTHVWGEHQQSVSLFIGDHCTIRLS